MFGMFGAYRKKATRAAIEHTRAFIAIVQQNYGLPSGFWFDPYVLGFLRFTIGHFAKLATGGKIAGSDLGYVVADVYTTLSNANGAEIARHAADLASKNDPDFGKGADHAAVNHFYVMRRVKNERNNPIVQEATSLVDQTQKPLSEDEQLSQIAAIMFMNTFMSEVRRRSDR